MPDAPPFNALAPEALAGLWSEATPHDRRPAAWPAPDPEAVQAVLPDLAVGPLLGQGGMAAVYRARQVRLDRPVALKVLDPRLAQDPEATERFQREARLLARLDHPGIVRLHDAGVTGPWHWLLLTLVEGASLREVLRLGRPSPAEALRLLRCIADAVAHAHRQGIVHRDLKPENILLDGEGDPRVADFGLAKLLGEDRQRGLTQSQQVLGTAVYMAPEQVTGSSSVDARADVYALGVLGYELVTGHLPLGRFEAPSRLGADPRLEALLLRALERDPARRPADATVFARELDSATTVLAAETTTAAPPPLVTLLEPLRPLRPLVAAAVGGGAVVLLAHDQVGWLGQLLLILLVVFLGTAAVAPRDAEDPPQDSWRRLRCRPEDGQFLGVAAGLARCSGPPVWAWRLAFVLGTLAYGAGILAYGALWLALRRRPAE